MLLNLILIFFYFYLLLIYFWRIYWPWYRITGIQPLCFLFFTSRIWKHSHFCKWTQTLPTHLLASHDIWGEYPWKLGGVTAEFQWVFLAEYAAMTCNWLLEVHVFIGKKALIYWMHRTSNMGRIRWEKKTSLHTSLGSTWLCIQQ